MNYQNIINKFVERELVPRKIPFYSCGFLYSKNKRIKPKIEVVVKRPQRFDKNIITKIPKEFMGFKVKVV